jgi:hypothetical protein
VPQVERYRKLLADIKAIDRIDRSEEELGD